MSEKLLFLLILCSLIFNSACQSSETTNKNAALSVNANAAANIPPEFSGTPSLVTNSTPGIPDPKSANLSVSNPAQPIPGITDSKNNRKPLPKNTPPIPGIPSEAELRRQMNTPISNSKIMERKPPIREPKSPNVESNKKHGDKIP